MPVPPIQMDIPKGTVVSVVADDDGRRAIVAVEGALTCPRCAAGKGCGAGIFQAGDRQRRVAARIPDGLEVSVNDRVEISLAPDNILSAALIVYGIPMLGAIFGAAVAFSASLGDIAAATAALLGLGAGLLHSRWRLRQVSCLRQFTPSIERLI